MLKGWLLLGTTLTVLGIVAFAASGGVSFTALIPSFFGVLIAGLALGARRSVQPWRWNLAAATVALLGLAGSLRGLIQLPQLLAGVTLARPAAVATQAAMALLCLVFLVPIIARLSTSRIPSLRKRRR